MDWSGRSGNLTNSMLIREGNTVNGLMAILSSCPQPCFRGFEERLSGTNLKRPLFPSLEVDVLGDDDIPDHHEESHHAEKKRRLTVEQVRCLEKSFKAENRLEPEVKMKLAQELCLQPRQVAVWYQNRRARWKSKQLEQDYDILKMGYEALLKEKQKLEAEVISLTDQLISREATTRSVQGEDSGNPAEVDSQQHLDSEEETSWETEFQAIEPTELQTSRPLSEKAVSCIMKPSIEENSPKSDGYNSEVLDVGSPTPVDRSLDQQELEGMNSEQHTIDDHVLDIFTCHPMVEGLYGTVYNNSTQLHEQIGCKLEDGLFHSDHEYHYCNTAEEPAFPTWWYWP